MVTPPTGITSPEATVAVGLQPPKRKASKEVEQSASPNLPGKRRSVSTMQRTPQANLTQTKLTGYGVTQGGQGKARVDAPHDVGESSGMDMITNGAVAPVTSGSQPITAEFLLQALRENKEDIVRSLSANMDAISQRVDSNSMKIANNMKAIDENNSNFEQQQSKIDMLTARVSALERGAKGPSTTMTRRATLSTAYLTARRSVRLWPIPATNEEELWEKVGIFLHDTMGINEENLCQGDIESIVKVNERIQPERIKEEVIVKFFDKKKRDTVFTNAPGLASAVDADGKPEAGIRLEIPAELDDTFRLLSRFGTRLRARHGEGTKRHVKFDDFAGTLYANVKLPGDTTPDMAREDLEMSMREENTRHQKRLASKLVPGPRERLGKPLPTALPTGGTGTLRIIDGSIPGRRPRWTAPDRGAGPSRPL